MKFTDGYHSYNLHNEVGHFLSSLPYFDKNLFYLLKDVDSTKVNVYTLGENPFNPKPILNINVLNDTGEVTSHLVVGSFCSLSPIAMLPELEEQKSRVDYTQGMTKVDIDTHVYVFLDDPYNDSIMTYDVKRIKLSELIGKITRYSISGNVYFLLDSASTNNSILKLPLISDDVPNQEKSIMVLLRSLVCLDVEQKMSTTLYLRRKGSMKYQIHVNEFIFVDFKISPQGYLGWAVDIFNEGELHLNTVEGSKIRDIIECIISRLNYFDTLK